MNTVDDLLHSVKVAWGVAIATTGSGLASLIELLPTSITDYATIVGMILSSVLIITHWRNGRAVHRKTLLEIEVLRHKRDQQLSSSTSEAVETALAE